MEIYYVNAKGKKLDLTSWPYRIQTGDILDYSWNYTTSTGRGYGGKISMFGKPIEEKSLLLTVSASSRKLYYEALNHFFEAVEEDVLNKTPGKIFLNGYYKPCYIYASTKSDWENGIDELDNEINLVMPYPFWCKDVTDSFYTRTHEASKGDYLDYPLNYPYDYTSNYSFSQLSNEHYTSCDFKIIIYGPCVNPSISIDGHIYEVKISLNEKEYLIIDSRDNTIRRYLNDGHWINEFNKRNKESNVFEKIPRGTHLVHWNGLFGFDITLFYERSEPKWTL